MTDRRRRPELTAVRVSRCRLGGQSLVLYTGESLGPVVHRENVPPSTLYQSIDLL